MIELPHKIVFRDGTSELYIRRAVYDGKGHMRAGLEAPNHLQHEEFVEVRVEQAAYNRLSKEQMAAALEGPARYHSKRVALLVRYPAPSIAPRAGLR